MQKVIFIIGLPGSGKTAYLKDHAEEFRDTVVCDDFYKSATVRPRRLLEFEGSAYYEDVRDALKNGKDIVMVDILFCDHARLTEAREGLERLASDLNIQVDIKCRFFENNAHVCRENILRRDRPERVERELAFLDEHAPIYELPANAEVLPVFRVK